MSECDVPGDCDALVIGGGLAGSTAATLQARRGCSAQLLEKARHLRVHIGESRLPMNLPVLERLGVIDAVERIGVRKLAADFASSDGNHGSLRFAGALDTQRDHVCQGQCSEFDELRFRNASAIGAAAFEDAEALAIKRQTDGRHAVGVRHAGGECPLQARWVMAGDAYAFVDPIFSSGVFLAMHGAEHAAERVDAALREPERESALQRACRSRMDAGIAQFFWFIESFTGPTMAALLKNPRNAWQVERAVISPLAGDVFNNPRVLQRLRLFGVIHAATWLSHWLRGRLRRAPRRANTTGEAVA